MIINGDSLLELKKLPENSVDSVVTDPPYGLSFMGKKWDYDVPQVELWQEVFRVLKPGGHLLAFAGTRTQHRMAVNIEDAGFEIRDMIAWVYGSGFPKSLNIGKAVDKLQGNEREQYVDEDFLKRNPDTGQSEKGIINKGLKDGEQGAIRTKGNSLYEGWGTALKPALEPITVARKPIKGSVAQNVLEWVTGGINIDGCRVVATQEYAESKGNSNTMDSSNDIIKIPNKLVRAEPNTLGRFPANLLHDGSDEVVGLLGEPARFFYTAKASKSERNKGLEGFEDVLGGSLEGGNDKRKGDRPQLQPTKNHHPTVKPVKLMQYLAKLVTPKGGTVLDPFNGSGTTGIACKLEGFSYVGIELDSEYCKISEARIDAWQPENISQPSLKPKSSTEKHDDIQNNQTELLHI